MSKLSNLDYVALSVSGDNYLQWALDTRICLRSKGIGETIVDGNDENDKNQYRAISIIRHHLAESLKDQYLTIDSPLELWNALQARYNHQKTVLLPKATYEWLNLRIQDYPSVDAYNSALFKIVSKLRLCGEKVTEKDMLEKTFSTFHSSNVLLQQQYRQRGFSTYEELISCLLLAETNNELLMRNSALRPPGSAPLPDTKIVEKKESNHVQGHKPSGKSRDGQRKGRGEHGQSSSGRERGNHNNRGRGSNNGRDRYKGRGGVSKPSSSSKTGCHRCGDGTHWAKNCRTASHLVDLYQKSLKKKNPEANMVEDDNGDFDHEEDHEGNDPMEYETADILKPHEDENPMEYGAADNSKE